MRVTAVPEATGRIVQPRQLIVTVYGLYSRGAGGWMSVASLVSLLGDLGVDEPAVRSSISRLKRRGILLARKRDGAAGYELSAGAQAILREGDHRIFRRERARLGDGWLLAVFSVPEAERHQRHVLRSQLSRLGFGTAAPGVWIAPAYLHEATTEMLARLGLGRRPPSRGVRGLRQGPHRLAPPALLRPRPARRTPPARLDRRTGGRDLLHPAVPAGRCRGGVRRARHRGGACGRFLHNNAGVGSNLPGSDGTGPGARS